MLAYYLLLALPLLSALSGVLYWYDKQQAAKQAGRIPEATLLVIDALGGWPGGWWAQQRFRHKTRKTRFRIKYFLAIAVNLVLIYLLI